MPDALRRSGDDYADGFAALLPTGAAWPREPDAVLMLLVRGLAEEWARVDGRAADLLAREADPRATLELLSEWEAAFGLPDPCVAEPLTIEDRRASLTGKMTLEGGQSLAFFLQVAADLGYSISIREHAPFMFGVSRFGDTGKRWEIAPPEMRFVWTIKVGSPRLSWFRFGSGRFGVDHHLTIGLATDLECRIGQYAPAHTLVVFDYS
ncbi:MAG TPA: putative phage tail protein [Kaistia sp.]|nr:putative phage tail protein [Kaistia sp.]